MKFLEFTSVLTGDPPELALLSTFQFDPDFFERQVLRSPQLAAARRIAVFVDYSQWVALLKRDVPARFLNRRYLVVPIRRAGGVFHPKLTLSLSASCCQVLCGSNNLTRGGCTANLELLNGVWFNCGSALEGEHRVASAAFKFFEEALATADPAIAEIVRGWMSEVSAGLPWLAEESSVGGADLLHTYQESLWEALVKAIGRAKPDQFLVISPFHDPSSEMCRRVARAWPHTKIELVVQQKYTNLNVSAIRRLPNVRLSTLHGNARRVHAKLIAWRVGRTWQCLVGSANFTTAAFDGRNVEVCFLIPDGSPLVAGLFDTSLSRRPLALDDFEAGDASEPEASEHDEAPIQLDAAILMGAGSLRLRFVCRSESLRRSLRVELRTPGERHPRVSMPVARRATDDETVVIPEGTDVPHAGVLLATLVADSASGRVQSLPVWVVQEGRLTHEPGGEGRSDRSKVEETGEGLIELLDGIARNRGVAEMLEALRNTNIRFHVGDGRDGRPGRFRVRPRDPYRSDQVPAWLLESQESRQDVEAEILDFVERHERKKLQKHARHGNINGMANFVDIFRTCGHLLWAYYRRGVLKQGKVLAWLLRLVEVAAQGRADEEEEFEGYLQSVARNLRGNPDLLQEVCDETDFVAEVQSALMLAQFLRFDPKEYRAIADAHPGASRLLTAALDDCELDDPTGDDLFRVLSAYQPIEDDDIKRLLHGRSG